LEWAAFIIKGTSQTLTSCVSLLWRQL